MTKYVTKYVVNIIESERGWGSRVDETRYFNTENEAKNFVKDYNLKYNTSSTVPDWYMYADYAGKSSFPQFKE